MQRVYVTQGYLSHVTPQHKSHVTLAFYCVAGVQAAAVEVVDDCSVGCNNLHHHLNEACVDAMVVSSMKS